MAGKKFYGAIKHLKSKLSILRCVLHRRYPHTNAITNTWQAGGNNLLTILNIAGYQHRAWASVPHLYQALSGASILNDIDRITAK
jgi:hypothetical protein